MWRGSGLSKHWGASREKRAGCRRRTAGEGFAIPMFDVVPSDVERFMEELWAFYSTFRDCFVCSGG